VGAGPAGLAAAVTAAQAGLAVTLIDEYPAVGGQYLRQWPAGWAPPAAPRTPAEREGHCLRQKLAALPVEVRSQTLVWGFFPPRTLGLYGPSGSSLLRAQCLILATGAYERVMPFPGWTLPGVMTVGGLQTLVKGYGIRPGQRVLLAGSGPFLLPVAVQLLEAGATVVAVLEATRPRDWLPWAGRAWGHWDKLREGWGYLRTLRRAGVRWRWGWTVTRALGGDQVEAAEVAPVADLHRSETLAVDTVGIGFGFVPATELTRLAGCRHEYRPEAGGWIPTHDERLETTTPGVFVAGETAGIGGADQALIEGKIAALASAARQGRLPPGEVQARLASLLHQRRHHQSLAAFLNMAFRPPPELYSLATEDTLLCRCEEVTVGEIRAAVRAGMTELEALKTCTRLGQGFCQGRLCGPLVADFVAHEAGCSVAEVGTYSVRPPIKPIPLEALAATGGVDKIP
jgi:NADPH-dependent 2,4-dienoyl-CoA reductase/sulfur reductase-like enzyme/bacterioferritin-associated ferredoxin